MLKKTKKIQIIMISVVVACLVIAAVALCAFAFQTTSDYKESDGVMVYSFGYDVFQEFIDNPLREILEQSEDSSNMISVFTKLDSSDGLIKREIISKDPVQVDEANDGSMRLGNLPVYSTLIDFVRNKEYLKKFLTENGVTGEIKEISILDARNMTVTIWLKVNQENFFITVDERYDDYATRSDKSAYVYRLYSYLDYCNKFGVKDGKLFINGEDITEGNYVKVHYSGAYLPFRVIMENLGAKIDWDADRNAVLLICNDKEYVLETGNALSLVEVGTSANILIVPPGGYYYCRIIDGRTIMNNYALQAIVRLMGAKIEVKYDELIVNISN